MKNFFEGIRIAEEQLSGFFSGFGFDVSPRESAFILAVVLSIICAIATVISIGTITGENVILGKEYGKFSARRATVKIMFSVIAIVFGILTFLVFVVDGLANFTNTAMFFSYLKAIVLCIVIEVVAFFVGAFIGGSNEIKRDKKYNQEISTILFDNPIYVEALNRIKNDEKIKMVVFFRDGISFCDSVKLPDDNRKKETSYYDENFPEKEKNKVLATTGSVVHSLSKSRIKFSDYGYQDSETAMQDLYKYIYEATSPRFKKIEYKKEWIYHKIGATSGPTGAIVNGNMITFTGSSSEPDKTESSGEILISCILYDDSDDSMDDVNSLKKW